MLSGRAGPLFFSEPGFTLIEAIVVLLLMGLLAAIALPNWRALLPGYHLHSAARQIQSDLQRTKARAVSGNTDFRLVFAKTNYSIEKKGDTTWQSTGESRVLPEGIDVRGMTTAALGFTARGTATPGTGGTVKLCNADGRGKNVVVSSTGRIRSCRPDACSGTC